MTDALTLPVWPPATYTPFWTSALQFYSEWFRLYGSANLAIAMVTNAEFESAFKSGARGDNDEAFNDYQDHIDRVLAILKATGIDLRTETSIPRIVEAANWELSNTHAKARDAILAATSAHDAAMAACIYFEGAGAPNAAERRGLGADRWETWFAEHKDELAAFDPEQG